MNKSEHPAGSLVLGIDGGGTRTTVWLASLECASEVGEYTVLGKATSGPANQRAVGAEIAKQNLELAIDSAFRDAGMQRVTVAAACLGLAGADRESDRRLIEDWATVLQIAKSVEVVNDAIPLLHCGRGNGVGVALIAGTGSIAWGRNATGQTARCGGWGYLFSDEGSAFGIGRAVLQAISLAVDGRAERTILVDLVTEKLSLSSIQNLVPAIYSHEAPRAVVASLATLAFAASAQSDKIAMQILQTASSELAEMAVVTAGRLALHPAVSLSISGTVLLRNPEFRQQVVARIVSAGVQLERTNVVEHPVSGAVSMAARMARTHF